MRFRIKPTDETFYDLFAKSARHLVEGARLLGEVVDENSDRAAKASEMKDAEHRCDEVTHDTIRRVNSTFVTPFDREDIYRLAAALDDVMDDMEAAADYIYLYRIEELPPGAVEQVEVLQKAAGLTAEAMPRLRAMRDLEEYWIEINRLENLGDQIYRKSLARLFSGEYDPLTVMRYKDVVEQLEAAIDAFETVANIVEQIAVKES
jgi:predicted phosphate transport protein (TIGR00153 family)